MKNMAATTFPRYIIVFTCVRITADEVSLTQILQVLISCETPIQWEQPGTLYSSFVF